MVDTGIRLLTGQEVSLKTVATSFVEGCVTTAVSGGVTKLASKTWNAVKNTKTVAKVTSAASKVKSKISNLTEKAVEKIKNLKISREIDVKFTTKVKGSTRTAHRNNANKALYAKMEKSKRFRRKIDNMTGYDTMAYMRSGKGSALKNPSQNWVWHHNAYRPKMQLIPKEQHIAKRYQAYLHPGGKGGFYNGLHGLFRRGRLRR